jgi:tagatose-1,6-bisphosphate aldolase non-catalytic subunit AgaZ/GatZ
MKEISKQLKAKLNRQEIDNSDTTKLTVEPKPLLFSCKQTKNSYRLDKKLNFMERLRYFFNAQRRCSAKSNSCNEQTKHEKLNNSTIPTTIHNHGQN